MPDKQLKNLRHETFCQVFARGDVSASEAYRIAGYSPKTANIHSSELVAKSSIKERIAEIRAKIAEKTEITHEKYVQMANEHRTLALDKGDISSANGALTIIGRACGYDKTITETTEAQRQLTEREKAEALRIAHIRLMEDIQHDNRPDSHSEQEAGTEAGAGACQAQEEQHSPQQDGSPALSREHGGPADTAVVGHRAGDNEAGGHGEGEDPQGGGG